MKIEEYGGSRERSVLASLILHGDVLSRVVPLWDGRWFQSPHANLVAGWCVEHHRKHREAPGRAVESLFRDWAEGNEDRDGVGLVETLLNGLSDEYASDGEANVGVMVEQAKTLFNRNRLLRLCEECAADVAAGKLEKAHERVVNHSWINAGLGGSGAPFFEDEDALKRAFSRIDSANLIEYGNALDQFFAYRLKRGDFLTFLGSTKGGKTSWMVDLAYRAMLQRKRVLYFMLGDETERQMDMRMAVRAARWPSTAPDAKWPLTCDWPAKVKSSRRGGPSVEIAVTREKTLTFAAPLSYERAKAAVRKVKRSKVKSSRDYYRRLVTGSMVMGVEDVRSVIQDNVLSGWKPDVCIVDYGDNLKAPPGVKATETRDVHHRNWQLMRNLALDFSCLMVTSTQANREAYNQWLVKRQHIGEDARKLHQATTAVGLNVTAEDRQRGTCRLNVLVCRNSYFDEDAFATSAGCWSVGNPAVAVFW